MRIEILEERDGYQFGELPIRRCHRSFQHSQRFANVFTLDTIHLDTGSKKVLGFTIAGDKITEIFVLSDPERLRHLDLTKA